MRVLLFVLHVCMLRECEGDGNAFVGDGGVVVSAGDLGGIRGSGIVSNAADGLWMSVVRVMRGAGRVCEMCMYLARGGVDERIGFGLYQSCGNRGSVERVFGLRWCRMGVGMGMGLGPGYVGVGGVLSV